METTPPTTEQSIRLLEFLQHWIAPRRSEVFAGPSPLPALIAAYPDAAGIGWNDTTGLEVHVFWSDGASTTVLILTYEKGHEVILPTLPSDTPDGADVRYAVTDLIERAAVLGITDWYAVPA